MAKSTDEPSKKLLHWLKIVYYLLGVLALLVTLLKFVFPRISLVSKWFSLLPWWSILIVSLLLLSPGLALSIRHFFAPPLKDLIGEYGLQDYVVPFGWEPLSTLRTRFTQPPPPKALKQYALPRPIDLGQSPGEWVRKWRGREWHRLFQNGTGARWADKRLGQLLSGIRGIRYNSLSYVFLQVPPPKQIFQPLWDSLDDDHKAAIFDESGYGKSKILLYLAARWKKEYGGDILLLPRPGKMQATHWKSLTDLLHEKKGPTLLLVDDLHQHPEKTHFGHDDNIKSLIEKRKERGQEWWLGGYTIPPHADEETYKKYLTTWIDPTNRPPPLKTIWGTWKKFFKAWGNWAAHHSEDVRKDPRIKWKDIDKVWLVAASLGKWFDRVSKHLRRNQTERRIYALTGALFLLHGETPFNKNELSSTIRGTSLEKELRKKFRQAEAPSERFESPLEWLLTKWVQPEEEDHPWLIPSLPEGTVQEGEISEEIDFPHRLFAPRVWDTLEPQGRELLISSLDKRYNRFKQAYDFFKEEGDPFSIFNRLRVRKGEIIAASLRSLDLETLPSWVPDLVSLEHLGLSWNYLKKLPEEIGQLENLQELDLWGTDVEDVTPLKHLKKLQKLDLARTDVEDVTPLKHLKKLQELWLTDTDVEDVTPLKHLKKLQKLDLGGTKVSGGDETVRMLERRGVDVRL